MVIFRTIFIEYCPTTVILERGIPGTIMRRISIIKSKRFSIMTRCGAEIHGNHLPKKATFYEKDAVSLKSNFLEAKLFSNQGVTRRITHSLTDNVKFSCFVLIGFRFGRSLRSCYQEFKFLMVAGVYREGRGRILSDFRELNFCGPSGPCYLKLH